MTQKIKNLVLCTALLVPVVSFFATPMVFADSQTNNVTCADGSTQLKLTDDKSAHTVTVSCTSGAKLYYLTSDDPNGDQPIGVTITCPSGESVGSSVTNANQANDNEVFYCTTPGHDANGDPIGVKTKSDPTAKQVAATGTVTCADGVTPAPNNDVGECNQEATSNDCATGLTSCKLVQNYLNPFIRFLSAFVGLAVVISVIIGGIQYGSSAGDPQKTSAAKNRIRNSIIALVTYIFLIALLNFLVPGGLK